MSNNGINNIKENFWNPYFFLIEGAPTAKVIGTLFLSAISVSDW